MVIYPFYKYATIGWAHELVPPTVALLTAPPEDADGIIADLSAIRTVDAFGVTYIAACFHQCLWKKCAVRVRPPSSEAIHNELRRMGLYEAFGLWNRGFRPSPPDPSRVNLIHLREQQPGFIESLLDFLQQMQPFTEGLRPSIRMALIELVGNFAEHARSTGGAWVVGNFKRSEKDPRITLCMLDLGEGIPDVLRTVPKYAPLSDPQLLELATHDGVSSVSDSRGHGLSVIRSFVKVNEGTLRMIAGQGNVQFFKAERPKLWTLPVRFPGSVVYLSLVPSKRGLYIL